MPQARRPDLQDGGLVRSLGGWAAVQALRRGREHYAADERILGSSAFVATLCKEIEAPPPWCRWTPLSSACARPRTSRHRSCKRGVAGWRSVAREGIAYLALDVEGHPAPRLVALLGVRPPSIHKAAQAGRTSRKRWDPALRSEKK
jgi:hypothetical protein